MTTAPGPEEIARLPYRPCVGILLLNRAGQVFVAERRDTPGAWQMPQGGIDEGEDPAAAARRELREEIGTDKASILAEAREWLRYDLPPELIPTVWGGRYRGQSQKWFAMRFEGDDADIELDGHEEPEFDAWRWVDPEEVPALIVEFKRPVYERVLGEFAPLLIGGR